MCVCNNNNVSNSPFLCVCVQAHMKIFAAYGSTKDITVYSSLGLPPSHIYIVGRPTKKMSSQCQVPN